MTFEMVALFILPLLREQRAADGFEPRPLWTDYEAALKLVREACPSKILPGGTGTEFLSLFARIEEGRFE
jgi:hypothetical protein